ncbi:MAG: hypothetical protein WCF84_19085 [Anaerolineae bacterium]
MTESTACQVFCPMCGSKIPSDELHHCPEYAHLAPLTVTITVTQTIGQARMVERSEQSATVAHTLWSEWMRELFERSEELTGHRCDGSVLIPRSIVERCVRLINTPYNLLSEQERQSAQRLAERMLCALQNAQ